MEHKILEPDSRGRLSMGSLLIHDRYIAWRDESGRIVLEPAVVLTATEARLLADPGFRERVEQAAQQPGEPFEFDTL